MRENNNLFVNLAIWLINNLWKKHIGAYYNKKYKIICRFYPTCSDYTIMALGKYGLLKGLGMMMDRVKRCTITNTDSCYDCP